MREELQRTGSLTSGRRTVTEAVEAHLQYRPPSDQDEWIAALIVDGLGPTRLADLSIGQCDEFFVQTALDLQGRRTSSIELSRPTGSRAARTSAALQHRGSDQSGYPCRPTQLCPIDSLAVRQSRHRPIDHSLRPSAHGHPHAGRRWSLSLGNRRLGGNLRGHDQSGLPASSTSPFGSPPS